MCVWNGLTLDSCCDTINKETQMAKHAVQDGQLITQPSKGVQKQFGLLSKLLYVGIFIPRRELCIIIFNSDAIFILKSRESPQTEG